MPPSNRFIDKVLSLSTAEGVFHPWQQTNPDDLAGSNGPKERLERLQRHISIDAELILVGEAPSYRGCRTSGLAFTSERLILEGSIPRVTTHCQRLTSRERPWSEPSATTIWSTLYELDVAERTICWNAFPLHPYLEGNPLSNRTPTRDELDLGKAALQALVTLQPGAEVVAVGRLAQASLEHLGIAAVGVRHPSMGGVPAFRSGLSDLVKRRSRR